MLLPRSAFWTYGLAFLGAHLAFMPLLVLLLPRRVETLAPDHAAVTLSWMLLVGAIVAGISHITAGAVSDRWIKRFGNRRGLIAIGTAMLLVAFAGFALASSIAQLFAALIYFQVALNCCFAPLGVLLADHFPDEIKGRLGGLSNAALPASSLLILPIAWIFPEDDPRAFLAIGVISVGCIAPLLFHWPLDAVLDEQKNTPSISKSRAPSYFASDFALAWLARLAVQTGAAFVFGYIYLYIADMPVQTDGWEDASASDVLAALTAPAALLAIIATLLGGYISDIRQMRRLPLFVFACVFGVGMGVLASASQLVGIFIAYGLIQIGLAAFLSADTALVAQLVQKEPRRGLLLGVMNLANTLPAIIAPLVGVMAFDDEQLSGALRDIFATFAIAGIAAGVMMLLVRSVR